LSGKLKRSITLSFGFVAIGLHGLLLHRWIDVAAGQNLNFFNMLSFVTWLIGLITLLTALVKPVESLLLWIFPLNAISIVLILCFPQSRIVATAGDPKQLIHIFLSALSFSVLCIAGLQALFLAYLQRRLRDKSKIFPKLPPLETMEALLFQIIGIGFLLLSFVVITGLYFFYDRITLSLVQKIVLAFIAWIIFGILLVGRYYFGWRGKRAIYGTLTGVLLLIIIYFGSILL
jgi:ABC-type uncharacterized transport system permease subunit